MLILRPRLAPSPPPPPRRPPLQTLDGHSHNVSTVAFHPELPLIMTGGEDGTVKLWHSTTYRLENTLNYGMERVWAVGCVKGTNSIAIGCVRCEEWELGVGGEQPGSRAGAVCRLEQSSICVLRLS